METKDIIRTYRELNKMSQREFAKALGVSNAAVSMWEIGERKPKLEIKEAICDLFNISMATLDGFDSEQYYNNPRTAKVAQAILDSEELSMLFDAAADADPEDLQTVHSLLLALKNKGKDDAR